MSTTVLPVVPRIPEIIVSYIDEIAESTTYGTDESN
jgi:hypothetical protein